MAEVVSPGLVRLLRKRLGAELVVLKQRFLMMRDGACVSLRPACFGFQRPA